MKPLIAWECPSCNKNHRGFKKQQCQNPHCKLFKPYQEAQTMATRKPKTTTKTTTPSKKAAPKTTKKTQPQKKQTTKSPKATTEKKGIPDQLNKPVRWTKNKKNLFEAMKKAGATSATSATSIEKIAEEGKIEVSAVRHQLNPKFDLTVQEFISAVVSEESRGKLYFLTKKGQKVVFD